jgi:transposase
METITLSSKQQKRAKVLSSLCDGGISSDNAAELMGLSKRQTRRLKARFKKEQFQAVVHGNQGRSPLNRTKEDVIEKIVRLCGEGGKYHDFNACHLQELLRENEEITIGRSTLDRLLKKLGLRKGRRVRQAIRKRRERKEAEGMMLQIDGSPHDWLEGRAPKMSLMGAVDDATGKIIYARFHESEGQAGYLLLLRETVRQYGIPMSIYHDRHTILVSPKEPTIQDQLAGKKPMSQVQRVMEELGIEAIRARSAQGKGRVERLWGTLQDRLRKEMRLAGISTLEEANAFLPGFIERYNDRFAVAPACEPAVWVPLDEQADLVYLFSAREQRTVRRDHTVQWQGQLLQVLCGRTAKGQTSGAHSPGGAAGTGIRRGSMAGEVVHVHTTPEAEVYLYSGKKRLEYRVVEEQGKQEQGKQEQGKPHPDPAEVPVAMKSNNTPCSPKATDNRGRRGWLYGKRPKEDMLTEEKMVELVTSGAGSTLAPAFLEAT